MVANAHSRAPLQGHAGTNLHFVIVVSVLPVSVVHGAEEVCQHEANAGLGHRDKAHKVGAGIGRGDIMYIMWLFFIRPTEIRSCCEFLRYATMAVESHCRTREQGFCLSTNAAPGTEALSVLLAHQRLFYGTNEDRRAHQFSGGRVAAVLFGEDFVAAVKFW